MQAECVNP